MKGAGQEEGHVPFGAAGSDTAGGRQELGWRAAIVRPEVPGGKRWMREVPMPGSARIPTGGEGPVKVGDSDGGSKGRVGVQCRAGWISSPSAETILFVLHWLSASPLAVGATTVKRCQWW